jgi:endonuclease YncB( thermonuclease family)
MRRAWLDPFLCLPLLLTTLPLSAQVLTGLAFVQEDASLLLRGQRVYLYGIYIPDGERHCVARTTLLARCGLSAALALNPVMRVECDVQEQYDDGSLGAICQTGPMPFHDSIDLGSYLIEQGLALAGPGAPFEYQALERLAQQQGRGLWEPPLSTRPEHYQHTWRSETHTHGDHGVRGRDHRHRSGTGSGGRGP